MQIEYRKKAVKYINSCEKATKQRLKIAIDELDGLKYSRLLFLSLPQIGQRRRSHFANPQK